MMSLNDIHWVVLNGGFDRFLLRPLNPLVQLMGNRMGIAQFGDLLVGAERLVGAGHNAQTLVERLTHRLLLPGDRRRRPHRGRLLSRAVLIGATHDRHLRPARLRRRHLQHVRVLPDENLRRRDRVAAHLRAAGRLRGVRTRERRTGQTTHPPREHPGNAQLSCLPHLAMGDTPS
ncbi:hypothetical protein E1294_15370 [Nonomuraea diastatica]|uniref:Uncharacterized protein n=1 Tax=Nonomuraea diastatica TaxID=1848329 RepID=A0A4V2YEZ8_9ACTN|nr:hypothetical protein E1294_15370 [Nonomuraea diastatica]